MTTTTQTQELPAAPTELAAAPHAGRVPVRVMTDPGTCKPVLTERNSEKAT
jgi:hypothetical protein